MDINVNIAEVQNIGLLKIFLLFVKNAGINIILMSIFLDLIDVHQQVVENFFIGLLNRPQI